MTRAIITIDDVDDNMVTTNVDYIVEEGADPDGPLTSAAIRGFIIYYLSATEQLDKYFNEAMAYIEEQEAKLKEKELNND